ncbi:Dolichyl-phosphate-mannose-protein mannosyltransferase [Cyclobacterium lianum]|uniref:Dolichyl-phosphate-mannose-protein mannosyltransferase n=1 Tax=Cyclobacterium lianum TaxID=388280 RepID=A0A1M7PPS7_9BACT|nr:glycosyltransferase family 39 protein [Cyclobacterium lianum]SHN19383.1 Dolichyl-phosphate-mannose-protein mannosyltransferase [Cyclobacterium lianum]
MRDWVWYLFFGYLLLGIWLSTDYGISTDEPIQRKHGIVAFEYFNEFTGWFPEVSSLTGEHLPSYDHRDYGMLFQTLAYGLELALGIDNSRDVFRLRHLMVFVLFWCTCVVFHRILIRRFNSKYLALSGVLMLALSPRIFGDSMYNPKDIPLLCWFVFAFYTHIRLLDDRDQYGPVLHGLACALAIGSRVVGIVWPLLTLGYLVLHILSRRGEKGYVALVFRRIALYIPCVVLFTIVLWPVLWEDPVGSFIYSFNSMKQFRWYAEMLYMGEMVRSTALPWHYIIVWIAVTTPLSFLGVMVVGLGTGISSIFGSKLKWISEQYLGMDMVALGAFAIPLVSVILLDSVLYNGWRHLYFVYPFLVYMGVLGLHVLIAFCRKKRHVLGVQLFFVTSLVFAAFDLGKNLYFLARYHPHQSVYFNALAGDVESNFERDYYGVSYKKGLTSLLELYPEKTLRIYSRDFTGKINTMNFPRTDAKRLIFVDRIEDAEFFITLFNFRTKQQYMEYLDKVFPYDQPVVFEIRVSGYRLFQVSWIH